MAPLTLKHWVVFTAATWLAVAAAWPAAALAAESNLAGAAGTRTVSGRVPDPPPSTRALSSAAAGRTSSASDEVRRPVDYLWVVRTSLVDTASVDSVIARARAMGVMGLLVQVVGRGDAYYDSDVLPRAEALEDRPDFDPLGEIMWRAHLAGLEVHAWMNTLLVWSAPNPPRDQSHVVHAHPEWVAKLEDGRSMTRIGMEERQRLRIEGAFLAPSHPEVRAWVASIAAEIARRYPVHGIHLDYIRHPKTAVGYDEATRLLYAMRGGLARGNVQAVPEPRQAPSNEEWLAFRVDQITGVVAAVRDSLERVRPGVTLSAAVVPDSARAVAVSAQAWRRWLRDGLVDRVFPMVYSPSVQTVMDQLTALADAMGTTDRVVPGIAIFNTSPARAALKIIGARELGYPLVALYSYDSLFENPERWVQLRTHLAKSPHGR